MQERAHVLYILQLLKDLYPRDAVEGYPIRLSALTTLHLAHALRGVFYPSNFTYPLTARFLMQRPELDASDVPLLYTMLYSAGDQWRKERAWMIRFLSDGMVGRQEWRVLKRRHTWDLVANLFHSEHRDQGLRRSVLEVRLFSLGSQSKAHLHISSLLLLHATGTQQPLCYWVQPFSHGSNHN